MSAAWLGFTNSKAWSSNPPYRRQFQSIKKRVVSLYNNKISTVTPGDILFPICLPASPSVTFPSAISGAEGLGPAFLSQEGCGQNDKTAITISIRLVLRAASLKTEPKQLATPKIKILN